MRERLFIQNDGMYIDHENSVCWFVDRNDNILNKINWKTMEIQYVCRLDVDMESPYRRTPFCYKKDQTIVAFPDRGKKICFYNEKEKSVDEYEIKTEDNTRIGICCFGGFQNLIWAVSHGMKKIFLIDASEKRIIRSYKVFSGDSRTEMGYECILNGDKIFCVSRNSNYVSGTDIVRGTEEIYELPVAEEGFNTICYDGEKYWLSGIGGNIYIWDIRSNTIEQIYTQNGTMYRSIKIGRTICLLPFNLMGNLCNDLLCCNTEKKECIPVKIHERLEEGIYTFEYIKGNNVIGINYSKNDFITEINIENGEKHSMYLYPSTGYLEKMRYSRAWIQMECEKKLSESEQYDINFYIGMIEKGGEKCTEPQNCFMNRKNAVTSIQQI